MWWIGVPVCFDESEAQLGEGKVDGDLRHDQWGLFTPMSIPEPVKTITGQCQR